MKWVGIGLVAYIGYRLYVSKYGTASFGQAVNPQSPQGAK